MPRAKLPEGQKRVKVFGRVDPATVEFLESLGEPNYGRAMDQLVLMAKAMQAAFKTIVAAQPTA